MPNSRKYGELTWSERISLLMRVLSLPATITRDVLKLFFETPVDNESNGNNPRNQRTTNPGLSVRDRLLRAIALSIRRCIFDKSTIPQLEYLAGEPLSVYDTWAKRHKLPRMVEEFVDGSSLCWIGPKRKERVVLYVHGGRLFSEPLQNSSLSFWNYVREKLEAEGLEGVGFTALNYSIDSEGLPAAFPMQLRQLIVAIDHLVVTGTHPSQLFLVGDSAGANIILQFFSHLLHPLPATLAEWQRRPTEGTDRPQDPIRTASTNAGSIQGLFRAISESSVIFSNTTHEPRTSSMGSGLGPITKPLIGASGLGGVYFMSPLLKFDREVGPSSIPSPDPYSQWGILHTNRPSILELFAKPYLQPLYAPDRTWFSNLPHYVKRVLISVGSEERDQNDVTAFARGHLNPPRRPFITAFAHEGCGEGNDGQDADGHVESQSQPGHPRTHSAIKPHHLEVQVEIQDGGIHNDPYIDFFLFDRPTRGGSLTGTVVEWLKEGMVSTEK